MKFHCGFAGDLINCSAKDYHKLSVLTHHFCDYSEIDIPGLLDAGLLAKLYKEERKLMVRICNEPIESAPILHKLMELDANDILLGLNFVQPWDISKEAFDTIEMIMPNVPLIGSPNPIWFESRITGHYPSVYWKVYDRIRRNLGPHQKIHIYIETKNVNEKYPEETLVAKFKYVTTLLADDIEAGLIAGFYINDWKSAQRQPALLAEIAKTVKAIRAL